MRSTNIMLKRLSSLEPISSPFNIWSRKIFCSSEIDEFEFVVGIKQHIFRFEVSMHDFILLMDNAYSFQKLTNVVLVHRFAADSEMFGELPKFTLLWVLHLQVQIDFVLEGFVKFYCVFAILMSEFLPLSLVRQCFYMKRSAVFPVRYSLPFSACFTAYSFSSFLDLTL